MRIAVCDWKQHSMSGIAGWVPSAEMPRDRGMSWAALDMRPPGSEMVQPAEGYAFIVSKDVHAPFAGALLDLGDDHKAKLPFAVKQRLENLFGINIAEQTPSRILAEMFSVHARESGIGRWKPVVAEQRYRGDKRGRWRIHGGGLILFDEFGDLPDEEVMAWGGYETFPTVNSTFDSENWPWSPTRMEVVAGGLARNTNIGGNLPTGGGFARMEFNTGATNMFTEANIKCTSGGTGQDYGGLSVRMNNTTMNLLYYFQGGDLANQLYYWDNTPAYTDLGAGGLAFSVGVTYDFKVDVNGSSLTSYRDGTASSTITNTTLTTGTRGGIVTYSEAALGNYTYTNVSVGGIYDTPAGGPVGSGRGVGTIFRETFNRANASAWPTGGAGSNSWTKIGSLTTDIQGNRGRIQTGTVSGGGTLFCNTDPLPCQSYIIKFNVVVPNTAVQGWYFSVCFGGSNTSTTAGYLDSSYCWRANYVSGSLFPYLYEVNSAGVATINTNGSVYGSAIAGSIVNVIIAHNPSVGLVEFRGSLQGNPIWGATVNSFTPVKTFAGNYVSFGAINGDTTSEDILYENIQIIGPIKGAQDPLIAAAMTSSNSNFFSLGA